jgi:hypothetical protein
MGRIEGRCLCGAISYTSDAEPMLTGICHCTDCRRQAGTAFSINVGVPLEALSVTGTPKVFDTMGTDRGEPAHRSFCGDCGSPIMSILADAPDIAFIKAGTLDDPSWIEPELELWETSRLPWVDRIEHEDRGYFARGLDT